jgi:hypothetical protein
MPAAAQPAAGTTLSYSTDAGVTWVLVGEVSSLSGVGGSEMGRRDTTVLSSSLHTSRPSLGTPKDMEFGLLIDPTDTAHQQVRDWAATPAATDPQWKVQFPITATPNKCTFTAFVANFDGVNAEDVDGNLEATITLCRNSLPTWA